jgi:hypothetical protein
MHVFSATKTIIYGSKIAFVSGQKGCNCERAQGRPFQPADGGQAPFELVTHIPKPAGTAGFETLPIVEWLCLELGRVAGFEVPAAA